MFSMLKKRNDADDSTLRQEREERRQRDNDNRAEVQEDAFIPYACHFDPQTILTKNGELMQVIKITGFHFDSVQTEGEMVGLRDTIRRAVRESVEESRYAIWFHTIRRKRDLSTGGDYPDTFSAELNEAWCAHHDWSNQYMNELYISVLVQGEALPMRDLGRVVRSLFIQQEIRQQLSVLEQNARDLSEVVDRLLGHLGVFGATKLRIEKEDGIYHSQLMEFLGKIVNLQPMPAPLGSVDLSEVLPSHSTSFGFNLMEVNGDTGRHFAALLSVKEHHDVATEHIDAFLQLPQEYIVTETFDFISRDEAQSHFARQREIQSVVSDSRLARISGLDEMYGDDGADSAALYGEHQITIMLLDDSMESLERELVNTVRSFSELGTVLVREDVFMEDCYWAQLPGNFEFIRRMTPIPLSRVGGYASLYNFPTGKLGGNHWGDAVTVFRTTAGNPYFFNFHYENQGHMLIIGPYGSGKTVLMNFLVSEARKFRPKLYYCDQDRHSEVFVRALGGAYHRLHYRAEEHQLHMNPFLLEGTQENKGFLYNLLHAIVTRGGQQPLLEEDHHKIVQAIEYGYTLPSEQRRFSSILPDFWPVETHAASGPQSPEALAKAFEGEADQVVPAATLLAKWYGQGEYAHFFDNGVDELSVGAHEVMGLDFAAIVEEKHPLIPLVLYYLHRVYQQLDGSPTIVVLDEAWQLVDNPIMAPKIAGLLSAFAARGATMIFATESVEGAEQSHITDTLTKAVKTQIYLPTKTISEGYRTVFHLTDREVDLLSSIQHRERQFFLKHGVDSVVAELNLAGMDFELSVLSATVDTLALMDAVIREAGDRHDLWLTQFKARLS